MNIRRKVNKTDYNTKASNIRKYVVLFVIAAAIVVMSNFMSSFNMSAKLKQSLSENEAKASQVNMTRPSIENGVQVIRMTADNKGYTPNYIYVQKYMPVKLIIEGNQLNSCNNGVVLSAFNIEKTIKSGDNIIEFTPKDEDIDFSCWMGMIKGVIKVTDSIDSI
jgi:Uncharacterized protein conserved in bacteria